MEIRFIYQMAFIFKTIFTHWWIYSIPIGTLIINERFELQTISGKLQTIEKLSLWAKTWLIYYTQLCGHWENENVTRTAY